MSGLLLFIPVLGAALAHAPVLTFDMLKELKRPLDGGRSWRGRRLFGDNKTWRGALMMTIGPLLATVVLSRFSGYWDHVPVEARDAGPVLVGLLVGLGTVIGELPNSFLKRQMGVAPGTQRRDATGIALTIYDQADLVLGIWLLLLPVIVLSPAVVAVAFAAVTLVHLVVNVIGHAIGARSSPI